MRSQEWEALVPAVLTATKGWVGRAGVLTMVGEFSYAETSLDRLSSLS